MLEAAQGGTFYANVARATGLDEAEARSAVETLCPAIAAELHSKAKSDEELYDSLLDLLEDNDSDSGLDDPEATTDAEAVADGHAILEDIYGSRNAAIAEFRKAVPDIGEAALPKLAAISATAVVSAIAQSRIKAQGLTGAMPATGASGGGLLSIILEALMRGLLQGAKRSATPRRRRRRSYGSYYSRRRTRRTTTRRRTRRTKRTPLEEIFGEILGTRRS